MALREAKDLIGLDIVYKDYLGYERPGKIGWFEDYNGADNDEEKVVWLYVVDEDPEYNNKEFIIDIGTPNNPDVKRLMYADLRLSNEVTIDEL